MEIPGWVFFLIVVLILIFLWKPVSNYLSKGSSDTDKSADTSNLNNSKLPDESDDDERMRGTDPKANGSSTANPINSDMLTALGYGDGVSWGEVLKTTELDPSTFSNHQEFVKDVRRFSSGANFTSVADDNNSLVFSNFHGLRRPEAPLGMIGGDARQIPDVDETVLARSKAFRWNSTS